MELAQITFQSAIVKAGQTLAIDNGTVMSVSHKDKQALGCNNCLFVCFFFTVKRSVYQEK